MVLLFLVGEIMGGSTSIAILRKCTGVQRQAHIAYISPLLHGKVPGPSKYGLEV
jgi:hypothetical protein